MEELTQTWKKNDKKRITNKKFRIYLLGILIGFINYTFELFNEYSESYYIAQKEAVLKKKDNANYLNEIKKYTKESNPSLYNKYSLANKELKKAKKTYKDQVKKEKFFGFKSVHFFIDRFGDSSKSLLFGIWVFILFVVNYKTTSKWIFIARITVITIFISTIIFDYLWIFNTFQDLSKISYYIITVFISLGLIGALFLIFRDKKSYEDKLRIKMISLAKKSIELSSPEKREEMTNFIKELALKK